MRNPVADDSFGKRQTTCFVVERWNSLRIVGTFISVNCKDDVASVMVDVKGDSKSLRKACKARVLFSLFLGIGEDDNGRHE